MDSVSFGRVVFPSAHIRVKAVAAGLAHSVFVDSDGHVWTTGMGGNGRLGHGQNMDGICEDEILPRSVDGMS